jgi:hypothetical protein
VIINALYDSSVNSAPAGYKSAIAAAIQYIDTTFGGNVTINVHFGWGETEGQSLSAGSLAENATNGAFYTYAQLRNALVSAATSSTDLASLGSLPATDPTKGGNFWVTDAMAINLHMVNQASAEAWVGLDATAPFTFDPSHPAMSGEYDAVGTIVHELTEVMGRVGYLGRYFASGVSNDYGPMDLFRYSSPGVRDFSGTGYFSADGGQTLLTQFNNPRNGGDVADWASTVQSDSFGDGYPGQAGVVTPTDLKVMDVLGYSLLSQSPNTYVGTSGADTFTSTSANETFIGNGGIDTVVFQGAAAQYTISGSLSTRTVSDSVSGRDGTDTLNNIDQLKFTDYSIVFDLTSAQDKLVYELYQAAFARTPDLVGFRFWATSADANNTAAISLADAFIASPEFVAKYGSPTLATYVGELYANVLGRAPDASGLSYWTSTGQSRDQLLVSFATSAENAALVAPHTTNGFWVA